MNILKEWKNHILQEKLRLGEREKDFHKNVFFFATRFYIEIMLIYINLIQTMF